MFESTAEPLHRFLYYTMPGNGSQAENSPLGHFFGKNRSTDCKYRAYPELVWNVFPSLRIGELTPTALFCPFFLSKPNVDTLYSPDEILVETLIARYLDYISREVDYAAKTRNRISRTLRALNDLYGKTPVSTFSPMALKTLRQQWVAAKNCPNYQPPRERGGFFRVLGRTCFIDKFYLKV